MEEVDEIKKQFLKEIYGYEMLKEALLLQLVSNEPLNILITGDNGTGKTRLLKSINSMFKESEYIKCSTLKHSLRLKDLLIGPLLENKSLFLLDDITSLPEEDADFIKRIVGSGKKVIAACPPKFGRYDPFELIAKQTDIPVSLLNCFDLIFTLRDLPNKEKDEGLVNSLLEGNQEEQQSDYKELAEYVRACKKLVPKLNHDAKEAIRHYYMKMRDSGLEEGKVASIPISLCQADTVIKMAKAAAMLRSSNIANKDDAKKAIEIMHYCLIQIGLDPETGHIDIDRFSADNPIETKG